MNLLAYVNESDFRLSGRVRAWPHPRWLHQWMVASSHLGDGWLWLAAAGMQAALGEWNQLLAAALAAALANAAIVVLKRRVRRQRPRSYDSVWLSLSGDGDCFDRFSFPSGHALNAFALFAVVAPALPAAVPLLAFLAASIAASRILLGYHFLGDVVAGALLGALIGGSAYAVVL